MENRCRSSGHVEPPSLVPSDSMAIRCMVGAVAACNDGLGTTRQSVRFAGRPWLPQQCGERSDPEPDTRQPPLRAVAPIVPPRGRFRTSENSIVVIKFIETSRVVNNCFILRREWFAQAGLAGRRSSLPRLSPFSSPPFRPPSSKGECRRRVHLSERRWLRRHRRLHLLRQPKFQPQSAAAASRPGSAD